jgi:hypothetical protein
MSAHNSATEEQQECPFCGSDLARKGICWDCYDRVNLELPDEDDKGDLERRAYRGGRWIVDGFMSGGHSEEEAIALAEKPGNIQFGLDLCGLSGLVDILADRWATEALRQLIIAEDKETLTALSEGIKGGRIFKWKRKRGPRPTGVVHVEQEVLRLKREGKSNGNIAKALGIKKNTVAAAYNNITDKIARQQSHDRGKSSRQ